MAVENVYGVVELGGWYYVTKANRIVAGPFSSPQAHYYASLWHSRESCH